MSRLAVLATACGAALLGLGVSDASVPRGRAVIEVQVCKRSAPRTPATCGPTKAYLPRVGSVIAPRLKIDCPSACDAEVSVGLRLRMDAKPTPGQYRFASWSGLCAGEPDVCRRTVPDRRMIRIKAFFSLQASPS
jgi:hypothetical protein